ncbi:MAG: hypothetical protein ABIR98_06540 [Usitatibacter sp.]
MTEPVYRDDAGQQAMLATLRRGDAVTARLEERAQPPGGDRVRN